MEANRDESLRCVDLAKEMLREGEPRRAEKFLRKALKLCKSEEIASIVKSLLDSCESSSPKQNGAATRDFAESNAKSSRFHDSKSQPTFAGNHETRRRRLSKDGPKSPSSRHRSSSASQIHAEYTEEDLHAVKRILRSKDYYEILGVPKTFVECDLKKQYRKLALQFHPDKNRAPGATEAFKAIGNAYAVLSDSTKRQRYDSFGPEDEAVPSTRTRRYDHRDYTRGFEADMTAEEIFRMFFGGAFPGHQVYRRDPFYYRHDRSDTRAQGDNSFGALIQLLPLLFVVLLTVFGQLLTPDQAYSLSRTGKYVEMRQTNRLGVAYYVQSDFKQHYKSQQSRLRVENQVEQDYLENLRLACMREQNQRESMIWRANAMGNQDMLNKAQLLKMPSCKKIQEIYAS